MTQNSRPWNGTVTGDAGPYSDADWQQLYRYIIGLGGIRANTGVFLGSGTQPNDGLRVEAQSPAAAAINVLPGSALVQGIAYLNDATEPLVIAANASGNARIDTVVVQTDYALQTCRLAVVQGTPAATPAAPSLTQVAGTMWEIPIADIAVANGFTTLAQSTITPRQEWVNASPGMYLDNVLNNSGADLVDGDVVIWDSTTNRAVTTTTMLDDRRIAGVWRGRTATANYGRVQSAGIGYVRTTAAVARGDILIANSVAKQAVVTTIPHARLARVIETTSAGGLALCNIQIQQLQVLQYESQADATVGNSTSEGSLVSGTARGTATLPANIFALTGQYTILLKAWGYGQRGSGNITIRIKIGGATILTAAAVAPAWAANGLFELEVLLTVRSLGVSGTIIGQGVMNVGSSTILTAGVYLVMTAAATIDTTAALAIDVTAQWNTLLATNTVTVTNLTMELK